GDKLKTPETLRLLKKSLDLHPVPNTSFIEIGAKSDNPEEAAKIANAVAEAYQENRQEQRDKLSQGGIAAMEKRLAEQDQKVRKAEEELKLLREPVKPSDTNADVTPPKPAANAPIPQPQVQACDNPFSTFSLNVS